MPYSKEHTFNTRQRILDSAVLLFSKHGYDGVTLDDLMQARNSLVARSMPISIPNGKYI